MYKVVIKDNQEIVVQGQKDKEQAFKCIIHLERNIFGIQIYNKFDILIEFLNIFYERKNYDMTFREWIKKFYKNRIEATDEELNNIIESILIKLCGNKGEKIFLYSRQGNINYNQILKEAYTLGVFKKKYKIEKET